MWAALSDSLFLIFRSRLMFSGLFRIRLLCSESEIQKMHEKLDILSDRSLHIRKQTWDIPMRAIIWMQSPVPLSSWPFSPPTYLHIYLTATSSTSVRGSCLQHDSWSDPVDIEDKGGEIDGAQNSSAQYERITSKMHQYLWAKIFHLLDALIFCKRTAIVIVIILQIRRRSGASRRSKACASTILRADCFLHLKGWFNLQEIQNLKYLIWTGEMLRRWPSTAIRTRYVERLKTERRQHCAQTILDRESSDLGSDVPQSMY